MPKTSNSSARKLRIGDHWNAIRIIALSQSNPLKAVAEFVENSIDAKARNITITRGKEKGTHFLRIKDDGEGIRRNEIGQPDFDYVATHICDSIKRRLKVDGATGLQGEFGIGLLSFWTVGEELVMSSAGDDGRTYQMHMEKGDPAYGVTERKTLLPDGGTDLLIKGILPGLRQLSGEKIQWYLASELRDRIRNSGVQIRVIDRTARAEFKVEPRRFEGRLLQEPSRQLSDDVYAELYLATPNPGNSVGLFRNGTRVLDNLTELPELNRAPWTSSYLQGIIDFPYLNLTPATRSGLIRDESYQRMLSQLAPVEAELSRIIEEQQRAEEEQASRDVLRSIQKALKDALLTLPAEEYDWFDVPRPIQRFSNGKQANDEPQSHDPIQPPVNDESQEATPQRQFFHYAGPLFSARIVPASTVIAVGTNKTFRVIPRDRSNRRVEDNLAMAWEIIEGAGTLTNPQGEIVAFQAPEEPGLARLRVTVRQSEVSCTAEAVVTVTQSLLPPGTDRDATRPGMPSYTFQKAAGESWRSRYDRENNLVVINNGHRDFVFASRQRGLKLRYICRLFAKELVVKNFTGLPPDELLERLIELSLHSEENLK